MLDPFTGATSHAYVNEYEYEYVYGGTTESRTGRWSRPG